MKSTIESDGGPFHKMQRLNRTLAVLNKAYSVLVHSQTEKELYRRICESVTSQDGFSLAWIGISINDEMKSVEVFTSAGKASSYIEGIKVSWGDNPIGNGPAGRAFRTGKVQFFNNMLSSRRFAPWIERAKAYNLQSAFSLPIKLSTGQVVAALMVYSDQAFAFYQDELELLDQFCSDLGYCVETLRNKDQENDNR
jgi:GAF domain-containing protein